MLELLAVRTDLVVDELPHRVADHLQLFRPFVHGPHRTVRPDQSESRQSDNGHVGFMRTSSRSSSVVTRIVDHGGMPDRTLAFAAATDAAIDAELFSNRSQLSVARTLPIPFAAAVAGVGRPHPPAVPDRPALAT